MEELEKQYLISLYEKRVGLLGETPAALGWSPKGQTGRYEAALELFGGKNIEDGVLADYGCGMGDFYGFLLEKGIKVRYFGFDINPGLVEIAKMRYARASFAVLDIDESPLPRDFDFALICGVFNQKMEGAVEAAKRCIGKIWGRTKRILLFDALCENAANKDIYLQYYGGGDLSCFANALPGAKARVLESPSGDNLVLSIERRSCPKD